MPDDNDSPNLTEPETSGTTSLAAWLTPGLAAALVALLFVALFPQPTAYPGPAEPPPPPEEGAPLRIQGRAEFLQVDGEPVQLCFGPSPLMPGECGRSVPVEDFDWTAAPDVSEADGWRSALAKFTGLWDGTTVTIEDLGPAGLPEGDGPSIASQLCEDPSGSAADVRSLPAADEFAAREGFQGLWLTGVPPAYVVNLAVIGDTAEWEDWVREFYPGLLCVGEHPGPSEAETAAAMDRLRPLLGEQGIVVSMGSGSTDAGRRISVDVFLATSDVVAAIHEAVGPDMVPWVSINPYFEVIG
ncbi:hypothetical protein [Parenemella sanctibonifatiensis]|uniref:Uncharacterized protein n=1 Tax=Parenemella sanctibonifatiensis TaxID=2016505 RepID=A0A255EI13_9ACTN|nr:hypothetical protein [Parenemella sanctibonifatiensis]OYN89265.1 hypothetical protein CGZ92_02810 [Parenemella sanctibonifatiensis]